MPVPPPKPGSPLAEELRKWEQHHTPYAIDGEGNSRPGNPYVYRDYPHMLYKAQVWHRSGKAVVAAPPPSYYDFIGVPDMAMAYQMAMEEAEVFTARCQRTVQNEEEERIAVGQGWVRGQQNAVDRYEAEQWELSKLAANAAYHASHMSEGAQAEFEAAQDATSHQVADVPAPKKRPGRPKKEPVETGA
jgi:hypothetical protein